MPDIAQLTVEQNLRIEERKKCFTDAATSFAALFDPEIAVDVKTKKAALLNLNQKAKVYFSHLEACIVEGCVAGAFDHPSWLNDMASSAEKVLLRVPLLYAHFRKHRKELGFTDDTFEPSGNIFQNMQGILALCEPDKAKSLKQQFIAAKLPFDGFDKPLKAKPMKPEKNNPWGAGSFYLVVFAVVVIGLIAIIKYVPGLAVAPALIALILLVIVIGALQLKNDDKLKEKSFVELMKMAMGRLFLFKYFTSDDKGKPDDKDSGPLK
jgi:hypothetical protein